MSKKQYSGRLELTWTNKDKRLLAHDDISYEWVNPGDYRVSEVRLLRDAGAIGETYPDGQRARDNLVVRGDALHALTSLVALPEFASELAGKVKLVYIDPPFNTGGTFEHYDDNLEHSVWLTMIRDRLLQIRDLIAPDGSVWLHLDDTEAHRARLLLDEVFGEINFVGTVIWQKIHARNNSARHFSTAHDYLLVYTKRIENWTRNRLDRTEASDSDFWNPDDDPRGRWRRSDLTASHEYSDGKYEVVGPHGDTFAPRENRWWSVSRDTFEELREDDRIWWGKTERSFPFRKRFEFELPGLVPTTLWPHDEVGDNREAKQEITRLFGREAIFATPKPERLIKRVIHIGSDPGDIVLDCFGGSGTTAAVAHKMGRRWVTVEWSEDTLRTFLIPRLTKVVKGDDTGGITEDVEWKSGGGFRILDIARSMFQEDEGMVFLSDWAVDTDLAEATAAQLRYEYEPASPFCGRKGRSRLAVLDGIATPEVLDLLVAALPDHETLVLCATAIAPEAQDHLSGISRGSRIRKIPASILSEYRLAYRARRRLELNLQSPEADSDDVDNREAAI